MEVSAIPDRVAKFKLSKEVSAIFFQTLLQWCWFWSNTFHLGFLSWQKMNVLFCKSTIPLKDMHIKSESAGSQRVRGGLVIGHYSYTSLVQSACFRLYWNATGQGGSHLARKMYAPLSHCVETNYSSWFLPEKKQWKVTASLLDCSLRVFSRCLCNCLCLYYEVEGLYCSSSAKSSSCDDRPLL